MTEPSTAAALAPRPVRIGNCSGFYGDRLAAMQEMLEGGELDYLTGDYLAELTMLILARDRARDPALGYAKTFLRQLEQCLGLAHEKGVRIVANAGGLNPAGLAGHIRELAQRLGLPVNVAHVEGDALTGRPGFDAVLAIGLAHDTQVHEFAGLDTAALAHPLAAHAYLGAWGIVACLDAGADVVVTGRVTDASVIVAPAAAHFGWKRTDFDRLAGAVVAGHVIECGTQATGGNYSFFREIPDLRHPGFPIAEVHADGSTVITKHAGTGGAVTVGTVTAQLLYEITGARYAGPDVTTRMDSIQLTQAAPDQVRISGVQGEPPPPTLKVSLNYLGGFRNSAEFMLTGLDVEAKAALIRTQLDNELSPRPREVSWELARLDQPDADTQETASALLRCVVRDADAKVAGRAFTSKAVELALASIPGFALTGPPSAGQPYGVFAPGYVAAEDVPHVAVLSDAVRVPISAVSPAQPLAPVAAPAAPQPLSYSETRRVPLGVVAGARSGDKGGSANIGVWVRSEAAWRWLANALTVEELQRMLPEAAELPVTRHLLPNLWAVNFVITGILGAGVASQARFDPQAKGLGEWLRSRYCDIPVALLAEESA